MNCIKRLLTISTILLAFGFYQSAAPSLQAQSLFKISADEQPGNGSSSGESSGNEGIYIAAGVIVAAIVGYTLYKKFTKVEEKDTTTSSTSSLNRLLEIEKASFANQHQEYKEKIPVDLFFAIKNPSVMLPEKSYSIGIGYRF